MPEMRQMAGILMAGSNLELIYQKLDKDGYGKALILDGDELRYYRIVAGVPLLSFKRHRIDRKKNE